MREALISSILTAPTFRYSQLVKAGPNYVLSGMIGLDNESGQLVSGGVELEARKVFANLQILMDEFGLSLADLVNARIFTTEFEHFPLINQAWEDFIGEGVPPARSAVGVSKLPLEAKIEIEFVFWKA